MTPERSEIKEILRLMQLKDVEGMKKHFGAGLSDTLNTIDTLKVSLIRELEILQDNDLGPLIKFGK
jgi:hypothetical protein